MGTSRDDTVNAPVALRQGSLAVSAQLDPLSLTIERDGTPLVEGLTFWAVDGTAHDHFIQLTEGVVPSEEREDVEIAQRAEWDEDAVLNGTFTSGRAFRVEVTLAAERVVLELTAEGEPLRIGTRWPGATGERLTGLGARHGATFDQSGRVVRLGADRRYTGPDCPPELLEVGGIPQGDYAPVPWLISSAGYGMWLDCDGDGIEFDLRGDGEPFSISSRAAAGPHRLHVLTDPTPATLLRHYCRLTGFPALLPEWAYGHWKSRDVYEHQRDVEDDYEGYRRHDIPLDAIVIDSPWETQYNTWEFNPHQFPDAPGLIARMRRDGVRTVVWITPWMNLESVDGQRPPDAESERLHREPAPDYEPAARAGHFVRGPDGDPFVARWWMGTGSPVDFTSSAAADWWRGLAARALDLGVAGIKADDGEGYYLPPAVRFADGRSGAEAAWSYPGLYQREMQRALDEHVPGEGVLFGRSGWSGSQSRGMVWGGDQASDFWSLRALVGATLTAAASGFSNWSHDVGGYLGARLVERCPKELLVRWAQFGCFTPLMQAHGRFEQEAWTYDDETLDVYRQFVLLHERLVPYVRAAAATAARTGVPTIRPLCLTDPGDPRGWTISDAYGYGPALWVAPVLDHGATSRTVELPCGDWIDFWTHEPVRGGGKVEAAAPLARIPVWVRDGSILPTYPADEVRRGLGDGERERPLELTLWGRPRLGQAAIRLADGTVARWRHGEWSVDGTREYDTREIRP
jgi:alpha-glucosidase (family GH31 glycosyl hydrolase)